MAYFLNQSKYVSPTGWLNDLRSLFRAVDRAFRRETHQVKGRKRLYASSLAFKTVLALVPVLALFMAVLAGDAFSQKREQLLDQIVDVLYPADSVTGDSNLDLSERQSLQQLNQAGKQQIRRSVQKFAAHARRAGLAGLVGFAVVVLLLLRDVEGSFNFLWGIERGRPLFSQATRHLFFLIGAPLLASLALTLKGWMGAVGWMKPLMTGWFFSDFFPFLVLWIICAGLYRWVPNTKVDGRSAFWVGLLVAFLLEVAQGAMGWYTLHVLAVSRVYGALWVVPMILIWLYLSWTVILFGAEVTFFMHRSRMENRR